ncbi:MAG: thiamine pyrophosphate-dependent dehydrogenase E1 component subunit alpha [Candidatus Binatia bacterium]
MRAALDDSRVPAALARRLFAEMLRIRLVEEEIAARYGEQEMRCPVHLSIGQEAPAVGVAAALEAQDYVLSTHRAHAHYLAKGGDLRAMLAEIYGKATGCSAGKGGSMHLIDLGAGMLFSTPIVGGSLPVAVGAAFGTWLADEPRVTAVFFGEGATEEGVFAESLNVAALHALPVVFVCENNLYSVYSPLAVRQAPARDRGAIAAAHGIPAFTGDGNDVEAVYALATEAVRRAREGRGPTYLELATYRWREHCGPGYDNDLGYRTEAEFHAWRARCPIETYERRLRRQRILRDADVVRMRAAIRREIDEAFAYAQASPFPAPDRLLHGVYAEAAS